MERRLAVVTGGSRGIGAATARMLAGSGWSVLLTYRSERAAAQAVVADCLAAGAWAEAVELDVSDEGAVESVFRALPSEAGPLRGLVNNAGIVAPTSRVVDLSAERVRRVLEVVLEGVRVVHRRVDRIVVRDGSVADVPGALPEAQLVDQAAERLECADALHDARVVALDALVEFEEDEVADHGRSQGYEGGRPALGPTWPRRRATS